MIKVTKNSNIMAQKYNIWSINDLENHYKRNDGGHWFDKATMKFFNSRLSDAIYYGKKHIYFVSSEVNPSGVRRYSVRKYNPEEIEIYTVGEFFSYNSLQAAKIAARACAENEISEEKE